jgi:hypothetical protein
VAEVRPERGEGRGRDGKSSVGAFFGASSTP